MKTRKLGGLPTPLVVRKIMTTEEDRQKPSAGTTREEAQAWAARWKLVNDAEIAELRSTPIDVKFRQVAALMATPYFEGEQENRDLDVAATRAIWQKLRAAYVNR